MNDFSSVFSAALQLHESDRRLLIDALMDSVPADRETQFSEEYLKEIGRRVAEIKAGTVEGIPWTVIREEALARLHHGKSN